LEPRQSAKGKELLEAHFVGSSAGVCCRRLDVFRFDVVRGRLIIQDRPVVTTVQIPSTANSSKTNPCSIQSRQRFVEQLWSRAVEAHRSPPKNAPSLKPQNEA